MTNNTNQITPDHRVGAMKRSGVPLGTQKPNGPACGVARGKHRQVVVRLDPLQFNEVRARATRENTSMAEQIRLLLEWGLEAAEIEE